MKNTGFYQDKRRTNTRKNKKYMNKNYFSYILNFDNKILTQLINLSLSTLFSSAVTTNTLFLQLAFQIKYRQDIEQLKIKYKLFQFYNNFKYLHIFRYNKNKNIASNKK